MSHIFSSYIFASVFLRNKDYSCFSWPPSSFYYFFCTEVSLADDIVGFWKSEGERSARCCGARVAHLLGTVAEAHSSVGAAPGKSLCLVAHAQQNEGMTVGFPDDSPVVRVGVCLDCFTLPGWKTS